MLKREIQEMLTEKHQQINPPFPLTFQPLEEKNAYADYSFNNGVRMDVDEIINEFGERGEEQVKNRSFAYYYHELGHAIDPHLKQGMEVYRKGVEKLSHLQEGTEEYKKIYTKTLSVSLELEKDAWEYGSRWAKSDPNVMKVMDEAKEHFAKEGIFQYGFVLNNDIADQRNQEFDHHLMMYEEVKKQKSLMPEYGEKIDSLLDEFKGKIKNLHELGAKPLNSDTRVRMVEHKELELMPKKMEKAKEKTLER